MFSNPKDIFSSLAPDSGTRRNRQGPRWKVHWRQTFDQAGAAAEALDSSRWYYRPPEGSSTELSDTKLNSACRDDTPAELGTTVQHSPRFIPCDTASEEAGTGIRSAQTPREITLLLLDVLPTHHFLYEQLGVLHKNIGPNSILHIKPNVLHQFGLYHIFPNEPRSPDVGCAILIDQQMSESLHEFEECDIDTRYQGPHPLLSTRLLHNYLHLSPNFFRHSLIDDLEGFLYFLVCEFWVHGEIAAATPVASTSSSLVGLSKPQLEWLSAFRDEDLQKTMNAKRALTIAHSQATPQCLPVNQLVASLLRTFFQHELSGTSSRLDDERLYERVIGAFRTCVMSENAVMDRGWGGIFREAVAETQPESESSLFDMLDDLDDD
ncbi:hypothetical protein DL93DRAFT_2169495 [Clavulina sp. PMI_390]|nr:hypothetical protein DL93DRAFT_2169495 [Clavulina sp. PMI_390]